MSDIPHPLELASEDQLIQELRRRNEALVVIRHKHLNIKEGDETFVVNWYGGLTMAIGLVQRTAFRFADLVCAPGQSQNDSLEE